MKYVTDDGQEFDNEAEARKHEASLKKEIDIDFLEQCTAADFHNAKVTGKGRVAEEIIKLYRAMDKVRDKRKVTRKPKVAAEPDPIKAAA